MHRWEKTQEFLLGNTLFRIPRCIPSQVSYFHSSGFSDERALLHALESSKASFDLRTATKTHAKILQCGYGTHPTLLASLLSTYIRCHHLRLAHQLLHEISTRSQPSTLVTFNLIIRTLTTAGECDIAEKVFCGMTVRDAVSWNSMISCLVKDGRYDVAIVYFKKMLDSNIEPDEYTFASVISTCAHLGMVSHSLWVHRLMTERKIELNSILSGAVINMYSKCGRIHTAREIFKSSPRSVVSVWNAIINGLSAHGLASDALEVFSDMESENILPDSITFVGLLTACSHCGLVEEGRRYFNLMRNRYLIYPQLVHYGAMVDLFGRAGLLNEALEIIKGMPMEPDVVIWRALLSACRFHKRPDLGEVALANISNINSGDLVLMSNTYCSLKRWDKAEIVRDSMRWKGIHKSRGKSWVEVRGSIHHFKSGDTSHPEAKAIQRLLDRLMNSAKLSGYVSSAEMVLMDVSEEEKEGNLVWHSEKLALAYGLLKTAPGTEVTVFKNLRICCDCHEWMKLVSRMLRRVVLVRDRIRFHRFEGGHCSCGDYW
ncbi:hypothetical protein CDL15_Pgr028925 [Punica granatum]|uniref:DYW domain-containing protein n=1 Tax=Punica granatum TaxID=22663 RepID=A0A218WXI7_PUNGR|nr:hypothetical protein CDL15_Pgr028925 [Punica granatum]